MLYTGRAVSGDGAGRCQVGERRRAERGVPWPSAIQQNFLGRSLEFQITIFFKTPLFSRVDYRSLWNKKEYFRIMKNRV